MPRAVIADDEPQLARFLAEQLRALWPALEIDGIARHGLEAAEMIAATQPDYAFLDIQMPGLTGLQVAEGIEGPTRVVFVTAYDDYAVQAFEAEALDYVLKPATRERLQRTIARLQRDAAEAARPVEPDARLLQALRRLQATETGAGAQAAAAQPLRWIRASAGDLTHQIDVQEVLYFRADEKYTGVQTAAAEHLIRTPISELAAQLEPRQFWQIHRSTIVNLAHLAGTRRDELSRLFVRIRGRTEELPVSRAYVHLFKAM